MDESSPAASMAVMKHACAVCARKKIRCDRRQPCSNCVAHARITSRKVRRQGCEDEARNRRLLEQECVYIQPPPAQRHRRRPPRPASEATTTTSTSTSRDHEDGLLDRLRLYEEILKKNGIAIPASATHDQQQEVDEGDDHQWIASPWQTKLLTVHRAPGPTATTTTSIKQPTAYVLAETPASSGAETIVASDTPGDTTSSGAPSPGDEPAETELRLWQSLPHELKNPPVSCVFARRFFGRAEVQTEEQQDGGGCGGLPHLPENLRQPSLVQCFFVGGASNESIPHPEPRMILHLWQVFVDNVNPIMRIVHVPTTHQKILDASWDADNAPPATAGLLFAIYALALTSMSPAEYAATFSGDGGTGGDPALSKTERLRQYRLGAAKALLAAGLLTTRRFDVLQAFTLLILAEPDSELSSTLSAVAVNLGHKLGLPRETSRDSASAGSAGGSGLSFFDREMCVRLWWQILGIDARMRQAVSLSYTNCISNMQTSSGNGSGSGSGSGTTNNHTVLRGWLPAPPSLDDLRLPLNVNDADLHPAMDRPPVEHTGPTEMLYVRMKYETALWMRAFTQRQHAVPQPLTGDKDSTTDTAAAAVAAAVRLADAKDAAIDELAALYAERCIKHCDVRIPLHAVTVNMARMAVAQLRLQARHPRTILQQAHSPSPPAVGGDGANTHPHAFTQRNADAAFRHALDMLELCFACRHAPHIGNSFAAFQLLADIVMCLLLDSVIYVISMLRVRTAAHLDGVGAGFGVGVGIGNDSPERIDTAWRMVKMFYDDYNDDLVAAVSDYEQHRLRPPPTDGSKGDEAATEDARRLAAGATFVAAFTDLTLEAWAVRKASCGGPGTVEKPAFVVEWQGRKETQRQQRQEQQQQQSLQASVVDLGELSFAPATMTDYYMQADPVMSWEFWNDFLQI
ncbi:fungal specific transcription factor domain containing protein [Niveomyces insectorum RCEF 264]|uniref:Fungal specific transcription factor domain containing protein n=1 Tax=Niveomyces insectorum RCEF 264 TaxID=1081102 RepID=A0A167Y141_9HYPO|nr:fungal specific transcription factor domain containing protein [Niveomyces insectorum RCEF 264]